MFAGISLSRSLAMINIGQLGAAISTPLRACLTTRPDSSRQRRHANRQAASSASGIALRVLAIDRWLPHGITAGWMRSEFGVSSPSGGSELTNIKALVATSVATDKASNPPRLAPTSTVNSASGAHGDRTHEITWCR